MNFIHDQRACRAQHPAAAIACQKYVKRFRSGDDNVWWLLDHRRAIFSGSVSGAHQRPNLDALDSGCFEILLNAVQRLLQIDLDVVAQCLQWRDVNDLSFVRECSRDSFPNQIIDH